MTALQAFSALPSVGSNMGSVVLAAGDDPLSHVVPHTVWGHLTNHVLMLIVSALLLLIFERLVNCIFRSQTLFGQNFAQLVTMAFLFKTYGIKNLIFSNHASFDEKGTQFFIAAALLDRQRLFNLCFG